MPEWFRRFTWCTNQGTAIIGLCKEIVVLNAIKFLKVYHFVCLKIVLQNKIPIEWPIKPFYGNFDGAGDGNRTHTTSLEGWSSTTKLHLQICHSFKSTHILYLVPWPFVKRRLGIAEDASVLQLHFVGNNGIVVKRYPQSIPEKRFADASERKETL